MNSKKLHYSGVNLDRASLLRKDPLWIKDQLNRKDSVFIPIWQSKNLISGTKNNFSPTISLLDKEKYLSIERFVSEIVFLGLDLERSVFA